MKTTVDLAKEKGSCGYVSQTKYHGGLLPILKEMVEILFEELSASLIDGDPVRLSGFGNFELRDKNERPGRNPKTGEKVPVSARRVVTFRAGQKLRSQVELYHPLDNE